MCQHLARPECGQCTKTRLKCGGPRDLAIILYDGQSDAISGTNDHIDSANIFNTRNNANNIISHLPLSNDHLFTAFTRHNLLSGTDDIVVASEIGRSITSQSFLALSYTYFGVKYHDKDITQSGLQKYGRSLAALNSALAENHTSRSLDVLEAIMVMALIEVCHSSLS
jgi:hypothetical protein